MKYILIVLAALAYGSSAAPLLGDAEVAIFQAALAAEDGEMLNKLISGGNNRQKRNAQAAAQQMYALINGVFARADLDGDGFLKEEEFWGTFVAFDANEDDRITSNEYVSFMSSGAFPAMNMLGSRRNVARVANRMFRMGDINRNGVLDKDDATKIIANLDKDGDHNISRVEYAGRWQTILSRVGLMG